MFSELENIDGKIVENKKEILHFALFLLIVEKFYKILYHENEIEE